MGEREVMIRTCLTRIPEPNTNIFVDTRIESILWMMIRRNEDTITDHLEYVHCCAVDQIEQLILLSNKTDLERLQKLQNACEIY